MTSVSLNSRIRGALFGVATCDALGGPIEFKKRDTFPLITTMIPNDNFDIPSGCFTDDTSMTLCLAQSLVDAHGTFDVQDQVRKYIAWSQLGYMSSVPERGCFDIGISTSGTLKIWGDYFRLNPSRINDPEHPDYITRVTACQRSVDSIYLRPEFRGNGSLMRVAPIGLALHAEEEKAIEYAMLSSKPTHPNRTCQQACAIYTRLVVRALRGESKAQLAEVLAASQIDDRDLQARLSRYRSLPDWRAMPASSIRSSGYVIDTLEAALWAFFTTDSFRDGAVKAVNLGDDADTVGAVYGGLSGSWYGFDAIPDEWIEALKSREVLERVIEGMCRISSSLAGPKDTTS